MEKVPEGLRTQSTKRRPAVCRDRDGALGGTELFRSQMAVLFHAVPTCPQDPRGPLVANP